METNLYNYSNLTIKDTYKIENDNILERVTENYNLGKLYYKVVSKYEYSKDLNDNPISYLLFADRTTLLFLEGTYGKVSKNKLIKINIVKTDLSTSNAKTESITKLVEYTFDKIKNKGTILINAKPTIITSLMCE